MAPPVPALCLRPNTIAELIDHSAARCLELLGIDVPMKRWGEDSGPRPTHPVRRTVGEEYSAAPRRGQPQDWRHRRIREGLLSEMDLNSHACDLRRCLSGFDWERIRAGQGHAPSIRGASAPNHHHISLLLRVRAWRWCPISAADRIIRWTTALAVASAAAIVSYGHAGPLVRVHGKTDWTSPSHPADRGRVDRAGAPLAEPPSRLHRGMHPRAQDRPAAGPTRRR